MTCNRRRLLRYLCGGVLVLPSLAARTAPPRTHSALLIGNARYIAAPLRNPVNDALAMQSALQRLGFTTRIEIDADRARMLDALRLYLRHAEKSDARLVFFAGHGVQWQGRNYLIPVDTVIQSETDLLTDGIDLGAIVDRLAMLGEGVNIVIVDACRSHPFLPPMGQVADIRRLRKRGLAAGQDAVSPFAGLAPLAAPKGTLVAFSTAPGAVAMDSPEEKNGLYTRLLVERLSTPGLPIERLFKAVRAEVARRTGQRQVPWENSSLTGEFCFRHGDDGRCG
jgi:carboxyl-terminal processing protease